MPQTALPRTGSCAMKKIASSSGSKLTGVDGIPPATTSARSVVPLGVPSLDQTSQPSVAQMYHWVQVAVTTFLGAFAAKQR